MDHHPRNFPAASSNGWPSPAPWPTSRRSCWPTSPRQPRLAHQPGGDGPVSATQPGRRHHDHRGHARSGRGAARPPDDRAARRAGRCATRRTFAPRHRGLAPARKERSHETLPLLADRRRRWSWARAPPATAISTPQDRRRQRRVPDRAGATRATSSSSSIPRGTVQPVLSVQVGSFVSGPIRKVCVDFNAKVKKGQLLAEIDPLLFKATGASGRGIAGLQPRPTVAGRGQARTGRARMEAGPDAAAQKAICRHRLRPGPGRSTDRPSPKRRSSCARRRIEQKQGQPGHWPKRTSSYTEIISPVDGIVTDRKVDPGQTVASQFQTPVLFVVAPDLEKRVYVWPRSMRPTSA